jgi:ParB family chromosome partitioning protein
MSEEGKPRLGRGLAALLGEARDLQKSDRPSGRAQRAPIEMIRPNPRNPRRTFDEQALESLTDSIREKGIIQPLIVRRISSDAYEIVAGERRWRAAQRAGLHEAPIVVVDATDQESLEFAIIENVQRSDLNPIDEAQGYARLQSEFKYAQADVAKVVGKSRSHVANTLRLLTLPAEVQKLAVDGALSAGHARALVGLENADDLARKAIEKGLTVRDLEKLVQGREGKASPRLGKASVQDPNTAAIERDLQDALGLNVTLKDEGGSGVLTLKYASLEQLDLLLLKLKS